MEIIRCIFQLGIAFFEVWLCYQVLYFIIIKKQYLTKREKMIIACNILVLGIGLMFNRKILFFSHYMFLASVFITVVCVYLIERTKLLFIIGIVTLYYASVSLIDFLFAFGSNEFLKDDFYQAVYINANSLWQEIIFLCSRISIAVGVHFLKKKQEMRESFIEARYLVLAVSFTIVIILRQYQLILCEMAMGTVSINGIVFGGSLFVIVIILLFILCIFTNNIKIQKENKLLRVIEQMSEKYYQEARELLEKNYQLIHDMKNHLIVIRKYAELNENFELCEYVQEISSDLFEDVMCKLSGNKIIDIVLNQKRYIAECKGIHFVIKVDMLSKLLLSDGELCSLFGNLLDNAIEACEKIKKYDKWIEINISQKNQLLFIEISNSIEEKPIVKKGKFCSLKDDDNLHGYGLESVERIVEKYDGTISYQVEKNMFLVGITFFSMGE